MNRFKDNKDREWSVTIDIGKVIEIKNSELGIDLTKLGEEKYLEKIIDDEIALCQLIYMVVKKQCDDKDVSLQDFFSALGGDTIENATNAFLEALVEFFPPLKRQALKKVLAKVGEGEKVIYQEIEKRIGKIDPQKVIEEHLKNLDGSFLR